MQIKTRPRNEAGFTLIEVSLAIGIAALALVALLALVPQGVKTMKIATDTAIEARIHQQIVAEVSLSDWDKRFKYDYNTSNELFYYDDQGIRVTRDEVKLFPGESFEDRAIYSARIHVPRAGDRLPQRLGGDEYRAFDYSGSNTDENEVQLVIVEITAAPDIDDLTKFDDERNFRKINTYQATVTRLIDKRTLDDASN
ncbi:MAG: Verru_Chthon cassette protein B [Verrucomicrobiota bacterium]